jgi:hypothetical protein
MGPNFQEKLEIYRNINIYTTDNEILYLKPTQVGR